MYKRKYNITEEKKSFGTNYKVEMWDEYGCKRTIYEGTKELATERISVYIFICGYLVFITMLIVLNWYNL